jgi:transcriptional regulator with XRE-family HTH domain
MPYYPARYKKYSDLGLGARLKQARQQRNFTLQDLAERANVSIGQLSKIENEKVPVTFCQFTAIRVALGISLSELIPDEPASHYLITRRESIDRSNSAPAVSLAGTFVGKHIEPFLYMSLHECQKEMSVHESEHFIFMLDGRFELVEAATPANIREVLSAGDALYLHCNAPHQALRVPGHACEFVTVRYSPHAVEGALYDELGTNRMPGFVVDLDRDPVLEVGHKIGFVRRSRGLTAARLATLVNVRVRQLAAIEAGRTAPDVELLFNLARVFGLPITYFLGADDREGPAYSILRADDVWNGPSVRRGDDLFISLAQGIPHALYPYLSRLTVNRPPALVQHAGEGFFYVLHGEIEFRTVVGERVVTEILRGGDSVFLHTGVPYDFRGYSITPYRDATADALQVFWNPALSEPTFLAATPTLESANSHPHESPLVPSV